MKIAVDASALSNPGNGIGRYVAALLDHLLPQGGGTREWLLYGRTMRARASWPTQVRLRSDKLPTHLGRVAALTSTLPLWLARDRPDLYWGPAHRLPLWLPADTARVVTIHDLCWRKVPETMRRSTRWLDATLMPLALSRADRIIAVSASTAGDLIEAYPDIAERVAVVEEATSPLPAPLPASALAMWGVQTRYVLFVGSAEPRKNLHRLVRAFAVATAHAPDVQLVISGDAGWGTDDLPDAIRQAGIESRVCRLGHVDDVQLATLYRHALCLAMPSLYEGFGLPLLEAMAQATPILTASTSSMPDVVGDAGICVDPLDENAIAAALRRLIEDARLRDTLSARGPVQAARFCWARAAQETLAVFDAAVAARRALGAHASRD